MKSDLRLLEIADTDDILVFHKDEEIAIISKEAFRQLIEEDVSEVASYREF